MKTTVKSRGSGASVRSRRTTSIRSNHRSQHSKRGSDVQSNEIYVIGSMETTNFNYSVDKNRRRVQQHVTHN